MPDTTQVQVFDWAMVSSSVLPHFTSRHHSVLSHSQSLVGLGNELSSGKLKRFTKSAAPDLSLAQAQDIICKFFLEALKQQSPDSVLQEFKKLLIEPVSSINSLPRQALDCIVSSNSEEVFFTTLKRSIYILINNWNTERQQQYIQQLVQLLSTSLDEKKICTLTLKRLTVWRRNFVNSQDYQDLKLFASKYENRNQEHWSHRYSSYLLVSQSVDVKKPLEQQEAARTYSKQLKERFKLELAMYTARSLSAPCQQNALPNPTSLGDEVLRLIQNILNKRSRYSYTSLARIFINQTQQANYKDFKQNLLNYLLFSADNEPLAETIKSQLSSHLNCLYQNYDTRPWDNGLLLRTCNRVIEYFTTVNRENPSLLFTLLATQGKSLTLAIILLKIVLLCPQTYTHLECCLAQLIRYYKSQTESECQWLIHFLEVIQLTLTIYAEDVRYELVKMSERKQDMPSPEERNTYRIFSQMKGEAKKYPKVA